jgi:hypothetical protein
MDKKLESKELRPNSLYQVTISLDSGDKVIDSLRSFTTQVPRIFTTDISTTMTTSALIPGKKYKNYKAKDATAGTPSQVTSVTIGSVKVTYADSNKKFSKGSYDSALYGVNVLVTCEGLPDASTVVTISPTSPGYNWLSGTYVVNPDNETSDFKINGKFLVTDLEPGLSWVLQQKSSDPRSAVGSWYVPGEQISRIGQTINISGNIYFTNTAKYKPPTAAVYEDQVSISNTLKASITNSDILSSLTWEEGVVKDVPFFFFSDIQLQSGKSMDISKYLYMYESLSNVAFVPGEPKVDSFINATGLTLLAQKNPPSYDGNNIIFTGVSPQVSKDLVVFRTVSTTGFVNSDNLGSPSQMRVVYSVARYIKKADNTWTGSWIQKDQDGYPKLSSPELITGGQ